MLSGLTLLTLLTVLTLLSLVLLYRCKSLSAHVSSLRQSAGTQWKASSRLASSATTRDRSRTTALQTLLPLKTCLTPWFCNIYYRTRRVSHHGSATFNNVPEKSCSSHYPLETCLVSGPARAITHYHSRQISHDGLAPVITTHGRTHTMALKSLLPLETGLAPRPCNHYYHSRQVSQHGPATFTTVQVRCCRSHYPLEWCLTPWSCNTHYHSRQALHTAKVPTTRDRSPTMRMHQSLNHSRRITALPAFTLPYQIFTL